jgi:hypothetical protein
MNSVKRKKIIFIVLLFVVLLSSGVHVFAEEGYTLLEGLPGVGESRGQAPELGPYLEALFNLSIGIAIALSVIIVTIQGVKYMFSDVAGTKGDAKSRIMDVLFGILIIAVAYILLLTINPDLVSFNFLPD